jgi:hypothetical protein
VNAWLTSVEAVVVSEHSEVRWGDEGLNDGLDDGEEGGC